MLKSIIYSCLFFMMTQTASAQENTMAEIPVAETSAAEATVPVTTIPAREKAPWAVSAQLANYNVSGLDVQYNFTSHLATHLAVGGAPIAWENPGDYGLAAEIGAKGYFSPDPLSGFGDLTLGSNGMLRGLLGVEFRDSFYTQANVFAGVGMSYNLARQQFGTLDRSDIPAGFENSAWVLLDGLSLLLGVGYVF